MPLAKSSSNDLLRRLLNREIVAPPVESRPEDPLSSLHVAVQGCCHGQLDAIYAACRAHEAEGGRRIDLLLCCGDFQSVRNMDDMSSMAIPEKYKVMGDFPAYYRGEKVAPVLTLFIGGNHEASNVLAAEYHGGRIAPNIYYVGHSGVVDVAGLRIAGLSGIFKGIDFSRNYPVPPYNSHTVISAYHVREFELHKLSAYADLVSSAREAAGEHALVDVVMSHDWPVGITRYGNETQLMHYKPYFAEDIRHGCLGNPKTLPLLERLRPKWWFAAHLHCHFRATVHHRASVAPGATSKSEFVSFGDDGEQGDDGDGKEVVAETRFLALDKCTKKPTGFIDFIDMPIPPARRQVPVRCPTTKALVPRYDPDWLRVIQVSHPFIPWETTRDRMGAGLSALVQTDAAQSQAEPTTSTEFTTTAALAERLRLVPWPPPPRGSIPVAPAAPEAQQDGPAVPDGDDVASDGGDAAELSWQECV